MLIWLFCLLLCDVKSIKPTNHFSILFIYHLIFAQQYILCCIYIFVCMDGRLFSTSSYPFSVYCIIYNKQAKQVQNHSSTFVYFLSVKWNFVEKQWSSQYLTNQTVCLAKVQQRAQHCLFRICFNFWKAFIKLRGGLTFQAD